MKAVMLFMFFALSTGAIFAQNPDLGTGIHANDTEGCMGDLPAPASVDELMALPNFDTCRNSGEAFLLEPIPEVFEEPGQFGIQSGFAVGSTDCSWTYFYVYTLKCEGTAVPFTVEYDGGDTTQPKLRKGKVIPPGQKDMNLCYADIPEPESIEYIASLFEDNCNYLKVSDFVTMRTKTKQDDCKWIVIYVYTIWDHCTEPIEVSITYTGGDTQDPWFTSALPAKDITVDCDNIPGPVTLNWADNCTTGKLKVKSNDDTSQLGIGCEGGVITRTWEILDDCGNYNEYIQNIKVNPAPLVYFDQTQDINVACEDRATIDGLIQDLGYTNGSQSDRCGINGFAKPTYTIPDTSCGSFEVTYTFTDDCGYTINASLTVNIIDNINPSIDTAANNMTVECDGDGNIEQYATWLANKGGATASDNCDSSLTWSNDDATHPFSDECGSTGEKTIIFTVEDDCGNQSKTFATFRIVDTLAPKVDPAQDLRVICDGSGNSAQYLDWLVHQGGASASDDCSAITWSHDGPDFDPKKYDLTDFQEFVRDCSTYTGSVQVTFTATDACGLSTDTTATFYIEDSIAPVISTPASDMTVECDGSVHDLIDFYLNDVQASAYGTNNAAKLYEWAISNGGAIADPDLCSDVKWDITNAYLTGDACDYNINLTFTASDACGNESTTSATFHVIDTNSPAIGQEAQDLTVECDGQGNVDQYNNWLATNAGAYAMDACSDITWSNDSVSQSFSKECGLTGAITVLFTVTDECGLSSSTSATFTIADTTRPTFTAPQDTTIYKDETCSYDARSGVYDEWDNCNVYDLQATFSDKVAVGDCPGDTIITRTWSLVDECGNKADDQVQIITIKDNLPPVLTGTLPPSMSNLDLCEAPVGPSEADVAAAYTDNCSNVVVVKTTNTVQTGECGWATQFSYTIADECGNALDPIKILYWGSDQSAPELAPNMSLPANNYNLTTCLDEALMGDGAGATVDEVYKLFTDNCDTKVTVSKSEPVFVGQQGCDYHYYYEFTIVDNCDNSYSFKQHFSGSDKDAPVLVGTIPLDVSDINECLSEALQGTAAGPTIGEIAALYSECSGYGTVNVDKNTVTFGDDCNWIISHEYTIYDDCGNFATPVKITYSGADKIAPVWDAPPKAYVIQLYTSDVPADSPWNIQGGADCPSDATTSLSVGDLLTINSTFNVAGTTQYFYGDVWMEISGNPIIGDNCTAMDDLVIRVTNVVKEGNSCGAIIYIEFEADDSCGNTSEKYYKTFEIYDNTPPTGTAPADLVVECASDVPAPNVKDITDEADNCNAVTVTHVSDVTDGLFPVELITRTYRIEDACGNYTDVTQTIKVEDVTAPEITCSGDISVNLMAPAIAGFTSLGTYNGKAYYLSDAAMTGPDAFADALANGGYAVTVNDAAENSKIYNWVQPIIGNSHYFIGLSDVAIEGTFVWQNGEALGYTNWYVPTGEPNNAGGNEDCVEVNFFGNDTWNDIPCGLAHRYVLEVNGTVVDYTAPVYSDNCDPTPSIDFSHASGDVFPVGDTTVTITVVDASGNDASCSFVVTVVETVPSAPAQAAADSGAGVTLDFRAYPVPFNKDVNLKYNFKFDTDVTIEVYDTKGLLVLRKDVKGYRSGSDMTLPLSIIGSDQLYYVKLITNRGTVIKKIVSSNVNKR